MTENEAIRDLQYLIGEYSAYPPETGVNATVGSLQYCITALKEIQQYREIGTVEECRADREKQSPKKPRILVSRGGKGGKYYACPSCGGVIGKYIPFCRSCGQAIQWDENLEGMEDV